MTETARHLLARRLADRYALLRKRLAARLGSADLATEALHETWLRLSKNKDSATIANPDAYLFRAALNNAMKMSAAERRSLSAVEIEAVLDLADDAPDAERIIIARQELAALKRALASLSRRQREIFLESYAGEATHADLAARYKVSIRTVQNELRTALLHVMGRLLEKDVFAKQAVKVSRKR